MKIKDIKIPKFFKNFYFIFGFSFLIWMLFLDPNDVITQYKRYHMIKNLENEKAYYLEAVQQVRQEREELLVNPNLLEKFAREKFFMQKKGEDLYVIVEEEEEK